MVLEMKSGVDCHYS